MKIKRNVRKKGAIALFITIFALSFALNLKPLSSLVSDISLVLHQTFDLQGTLQEDASEYKNNAVCSQLQCPQWTSQGKVNGAFLFDGKDDYFTINDADSLNVLQEYTLSFWFKANNMSRTQALLARGEDWSKDIAQWVIEINDPANPGKIQLWFEEINDADHYFPSKTTIATNTWYHLAVAKSVSGVKMYINGNLEAQYLDNKNAGLVSAPVLIGARMNTPKIFQDFFNGYIDEVKIYNRELSNQEILALKNYTPITQCQDGIDNDSDSLTDMTDPGCLSPNEDNEARATTACQDGIDNDTDGYIDSLDPGCESQIDNDEANPAVLNLIIAGDDWRYFKGVENPADNWKEIGLDENSWLSGKTGIGYGDNDDATVISDMQNKFVTIYARKTFNFDWPQIYKNITLSIAYDDGFIAYVNGKEVARRGLGVAGSPVAKDTLAQNHEVGAPETITIADTFFTKGKNVLAIEVHNGSVGSSDLSLIPALTAAIPCLTCTPPPPPAPPAVLGPTKIGTLPSIINESSGIIASRQYPGVYWVHNDSGDISRIFAVYGDGKLLKEVRVDGAGASDWEDIAIDPKTNEIWIGDIGNNCNCRGDLRLYKIPEPNPYQDSISAKAIAYNFKYPDGNFNSESLFIWNSQPYIVIKESRAYAYAFPVLDSATKQTLVKIGEFPSGGILVTGADISYDGKRLALVNHGFGGQGHHWVLERGADSASIADFFKSPAHNWHFTFVNEQTEEVAFIINSYDIITGSEQRSLWRTNASYYELK